VQHLRVIQTPTSLVLKTVLPVWVANRSRSAAQVHAPQADSTEEAPCSSWSVWVSHGAAAATRAT